MRSLLRIEMAQAPEISEKRHEDELGQRAGMDAAGGRENDIRPLQTKFLDRLPDTGAGGMDPSQPLRRRQVFNGRRQVPEDVRL